MTAVSLNDETKMRLLKLLAYREFDPQDSEYEPEASTMAHQAPGRSVTVRQPGQAFLLEPDPNAPTVPPERDPWLAILDVEQVLGLRDMDQIPRPADYREAFRPVARMASALQKMLASWSGYYRDQFRLKGADISAIESALASLADLSAAVLKDFEAKSSKGARRSFALTQVVWELRNIFRKHCQVARHSRKQQGAFHFRADWEKQELEFVGTALVAARIITEKYRERELPRLFRDPRCIPSEDSPRQPKQ